jgi:ankyrin repeat protein
MEKEMTSELAASISTVDLREVEIAWQRFRIAMFKRDETAEKAVIEAVPAEHINMLDSDGHSMLYRAVASSRIEAVKLLVAKGADVNTFSPRDGQTVLMRALVLETEEVAAVLIAAGADPRLLPANGGRGERALDYVFQFDTVRCFMLLYERGELTSEPEHPLFTAAENHAVEIVEAILHHPVLSAPALHEPLENLEKAFFFDAIRQAILARRAEYEVDLVMGVAEAGSARAQTGGPAL